MLNACAVKCTHMNIIYFTEFGLKKKKFPFNKLRVSYAKEIFDLTYSIIINETIVVQLTVGGGTVRHNVHRINNYNNKTFSSVFF